MAAPGHDQPVNIQALDLRDVEEDERIIYASLLRVAVTVILPAMQIESGCTLPMRVPILVACILLALNLGSGAAGAGSFVPVAVVYDERFYDFFDADAVVEELAQDLVWAEGPLWVEALDALLFSDVATDTIYRWSEREGLTPYLRPSGHPPDSGGHAWRGSNGLALDAAGRLLLAQQGNRTLARMRAPIDAPTSHYEVLVERYRGKRINSPNDLVLHTSGDVYFTDPPYGLAGFEQSPDKELEFSGVFRLTPDGQLNVIEVGLKKPNGLALSGDQGTLFVSNSEPGQARIFSIDLVVGGKRLFYDAGEQRGSGSTDGMAMHPSGYLFVSLPGGLGILSARAELLGKLELGQVTNLAFDQRHRFLYVTTPTQLLRLKLNRGED